MLKKNDKGYFLAETIIVLTIVSIAITTLYVNSMDVFIKEKNNITKYNTIDGLYSGNAIKDSLKAYENIFKDSIESTEYIDVNNYMLTEKSTNINENKFYKDLNVNKIYFSKYNIKKLVESNIIMKSINDELKFIKDDSNCKYRYVIIFNDFSYSLIGVDCNKYNSENNYIVKFDTDGGNKISSQKIKDGNLANKPRNPSKKGYDFVKWTLNGQEYKFTEKVTSNITLKAVWEISKLCKRATTLHTEECTHTDSTHYCSGEGYTTTGTKGTTTITYGNLGTKGVLKSGDAFDCDVNGDGRYDEDTERFYYVTDLNTNSNYAVLIYYNNVSGGNPSNSTTYAYDSSRENWYGPRTAIKQLPTTSQWNKIKINNFNRSIKNEKGGNTTTGGTLPSNFIYSGKAARLLTTQESEKACNITVGEGKGIGDNCNYLVENTKFSNALIRNFGYWFENPYSDASNSAWFMATLPPSSIYDNTVSNANYTGVRPVIEISKSDISY